MGISLSRASQLWFCLPGNQCVVLVALLLPNVPQTAQDWAWHLRCMCHRLLKRPWGQEMKSQQNFGHLNAGMSWFLVVPGSKSNQKCMTGQHVPTFHLIIYLKPAEWNIPSLRTWQTPFYCKNLPFTLTQKKKKMFALFLVLEALTTKTIIFQTDHMFFLVSTKLFWCPFVLHLWQQVLSPKSSHINSWSRLIGVSL